MGEQFISSVLKHGVEKLYELGPVEPVLTEHESKIWDYVSQHLTSHGCLPVVSTVTKETGVPLSEVDEVPSYYYEHLVQRYIHQRIKSSIVAAKEHLSPGSLDASKAYDAMMEVLTEVAELRHGNNLVDARDMSVLIHDELQFLKGEAGLGGLHLGWPYFDGMNGGLRGGDLVSVVARPGMGKTFMLVYSARHNWVNDHARPMFVSMEMPTIQILTRLMAMEVGIESKLIKTASISTHQEKLIYGMEAVFKDRQPFYVVDGNLATKPHEVQLLARQLRPSVIYIDGAYLMKHPDPRLSTYARVGAVCEDLKRMATLLSIPIICSWQFNREAEKKKQPAAAQGSGLSVAKPGLESIAYSDQIGQLSTVVMGLFEPETIETAKKKLVSVIKGRGGEEGEFRINWDFKKMDFSQAGYTGIKIDAKDSVIDAGSDPDEGAPSTVALSLKKEAEKSVQP